MECPSIYSGNAYCDDRGYLRAVNDFNFVGVKRFYQVENFQRGFVRAWHGHQKEAKYIYVAKGAALVGLVNMRTDKVVLRKVLSAQKPQVIYAPPGYANGFKTLEDDTIIMFFSTSTLEESQNDDYRYPYNQWDIWYIDPR
jgi:dTDP-4-dehydrorhamnose 3,5-epimerase-like enzyme